MRTILWPTTAQCPIPPQKEDDINFIMQSRSSWKLKRYTFNVLYRPSDGIWSLEEDTRSPDDAAIIRALTEDLDDAAIIRALVEDGGGQIEVGDLVVGFLDQFMDDTWEAEDALRCQERALAALWTLILVNDLKIGKAEKFEHQIVSFT